MICSRFQRVGEPFDASFTLNCMQLEHWPYDLPCGTTGTWNMALGNGLMVIWHERRARRTSCMLFMWGSGKSRFRKRKWMPPQAFQVFLYPVNCMKERTLVRTEDQQQKWRHKNLTRGREFKYWHGSWRNKIKDIIVYQDKSIHAGLTNQESSPVRSELDILTNDRYKLYLHQEMTAWHKVNAHLRFDRMDWQKHVPSTVYHKLRLHRGNQVLKQRDSAQSRTCVRNWIERDISNEHISFEYIGIREL